MGRRILLRKGTEESACRSFVSDRPEGLTTTVLGIDLSSRKIALAGHNEQFGWMSETWAAPKKMKDRGEILAQFIKPFSAFISGVVATGPTWMFVENPLVGVGGPHPTIVQAQVQGLVLGLAVRLGVRGSYPVNVQTWKKDVIGRGNASKGDVAEWLTRHHPHLAGMADGDQDLVDAACIALYGVQVLDRSERIA